MNIPARRRAKARINAGMPMAGLPLLRAVHGVKWHLYAAWRRNALAELFRRLLLENSANFRLEDFSLGSHAKFWEAFTLARAGKEEPEIRAALPVIRSSHSDQNSEPLTKRLTLQNTY